MDKQADGLIDNKKTDQSISYNFHCVGPANGSYAALTISGKVLLQTI